ncbi:MAG: hypothetical protein IT323_01865 [Anaerolineae bacterium]|nr:hypothetical protein [Anaerolineae bacterium]
MNRRAFLRRVGMGTLMAGIYGASPYRSVSAMERPTLHTIHPEHIIGDVHPFFRAGRWYMYYLAPEFHSKLMISADLIHWQQTPITHTPRGPDDPELAPYYVLGVFRDEAATGFRTYHGWSAGNMHSHFSRDLLTWEYAPPSYRVLAQYQRYSSQRDPYVFWNDAEGQYWCVMTCKVKGIDDSHNGAVGFASSPDLQRWQGRGDLYFSGNIREPEVPQVFRIGERWYLLASVHTGETVGRPSYWVAEAPTGPWHMLTPDALDGQNLSAAQVGWDGARWLLFGWIPLTTFEAHGRYTWGGHLAFPREVFPLADGALGVRLEPGFGAAVRGPLVMADATARAVALSGGWSTGATLACAPQRGESVAELPGRYERIDLDLALAAGQDARKVGVRLADRYEIGLDVAPDGSSWSWYIGMPRGARTYARLPFRRDSERHTLRILVEEDMVELFADGRYSLCARLPSPIGSVPVRVFAEGGAATFDGVRLYRLHLPDEIV